MKKFLLSLLTLCMATAMWANSEQLPASESRYFKKNNTIQNIELAYDKTFAQYRLTFDDNANRYALPRDYVVEIYRRGSGQKDICHYYTKRGDSYIDFYYGIMRHDKDEYLLMSETYSTDKTTPGERSFSVEDLITECYLHHERNLHIVVYGKYRTAPTVGISFDNVEFQLATANDDSYDHEAIMTGLGIQHYTDVTLPIVALENMYVHYGSAPTGVDYHLGADDAIYTDNLYITGRVYNGISSDYAVVYQLQSTMKQWFVNNTDGSVDAMYTTGEWIPFNVALDSTALFRVAGDDKIRFGVQFFFGGDKPITYYSDWKSIVYPYEATVTKNNQTSHLEHVYHMGDVITLDFPQYNYKYNSHYPVSRNAQGEAIMPGCPVYGTGTQRSFTVVFHDMDGRVLSTETTTWGNGVTPPTPPTHAGYVFDRWSDNGYTNVRHDMDVYAQYTLTDPFGGNSYVTASLTNHTTIYTKGYLSKDGYKQFDPLTCMAPGDEFTLKLQVKALSSVLLRLQYKQDGGEWQDSYSKTLTQAEAQAGYTWTRNISITDATDSYIQSRSYRFQVVTAQKTVYSEAFNLEMFYPITIMANDRTVVEWEDNNWTMTIPANNGTILMMPYHTNYAVYLPNGNADCMNVTSSTGYVTEAPNAPEDEHKMYLSCAGRTEVITVGQKTYNVYFEVIGAPNIGYGRNVIEKQTVGCGEAATAPTDIVDPITPEANFIGWSVPFDNVTDDIWTTAMFESLPEITYYTVTFRDQNGNVLATVEVAEGDNAVEPENVPVLDGYIFTGWSSSVNNVTGNLDVTAQYITIEEYIENLPEGVDQLTNEQPVVKTIRNGQVVIIRGNNIYNMLGNEVE